MNEKKEIPCIGWADVSTTGSKEPVHFIGVDISQDESKTSFVKLHPGMIFTVGVGFMEGERPKPGERCLWHNSFECVEVLRVVDMLLFNFRDGLSGWQRFLFKLNAWFRLGPKEYKKPVYYKIRFLGVEG